MSKFGEVSKLASILAMHRERDLERRMNQILEDMQKACRIAEAQRAVAVEKSKRSIVA